MNTTLPFRRAAALVPLGLLTVVAAIAAPTLVTASPALAAAPATGEAVVMSRLEGFSYFQLPDNGKRLADARLTRELTERLKDYAKDQGITLTGAAELVVYEGEAATDFTRTMLQSSCTGMGMNYKDGPGDRFTARSTGGDNLAVVGFWTVRDGALILTWGSSGPKKEEPTPLGTDTPAASTGASSEPVRIIDVSHPTPISPAPSGPPASGRKIAPPASIVGGTWSWTSIARVGYVNTTTGSLASPSGMSARFSFTKDGRYQYFFYVQQIAYGLPSQSTTRESGTATFYDDGRVILRPSKGHYDGENGSNVINRDMTESERRPRTFYWEWRTDGGKRQLYLGPSRGSMSLFKRG
jgi:hypothetical protein